ncbi:type IV secretion system DNA-binding domain-containing protein [Candidatus Peregrinibacteria bacterium]|nr:type IV secretion system DNA-binding domain-containing protein [Candidatus Peregrinibacteria bacterium]
MNHKPSNPSSGDRLPQVVPTTPAPAKTSFQESVTLVDDFKYTPGKRKVMVIKIPQTDKDDIREKVLAYRVEPHIIFSKFFEQLIINLHHLFHHHLLSFEVVSFKQHIYFYVSTHPDYFQLLRGQIYAMYPTCEIETVDDYADVEFLSKTHEIAIDEMVLEKSDIFPIKMYNEFKKDSMAGILSVLSKAEKDERIWVQFIVKPQEDNGRHNFIQNLKKFVNRFINIFRFKYYFKQKGMKGIKEQQKHAFEEKNSHEAYHVTTRIVYLTPKNNPAFKAQSKIHVLSEAFKQFNTIDLNRFKPSHSMFQEKLLKAYQERTLGRSFILCDEEMATVFHLPNQDEVPNIVHVMAKKSEPPNTLPTENKEGEVAFFGMTNFHNQYFRFGIKYIDRRRHLYLVGKSGSGKSKMLELLLKEDLEKGKGIGVLDPHGDLVDAVLRFVPEHRIKDVVIVDPTDMTFPVAFNLLEDVPQEMKVRITIGIIDIFKKLFGTNWTTRLEHVLRYTLLALLDSPNTTILSILKMLSDKNYRQKIVSRIEDSVVKNFWVNEFAAWSEKFDNEAITPLLNKVGQFVSTSLIRNIVGQPKSKFDIRKLMDEGKILLIKVSKGILGEENAQLLGAMIVTKIYQSAMMRADTLEEKRRDFYFYVDEFQNFATDSFGEILSEARKYRLNLTLAHQFMGQLSEPIRKTVFGNVGSLVSFRVGGDDAKVLENEFTPIFHERDFINLSVRDFYSKISIDGQTKDAFSGRTLDVDYPQQDFVDRIKENSRKMYAIPKKEVEDLLKKWDESSGEAFDSMTVSQDFVEPIIDL